MSFKARMSQMSSNMLPVPVGTSGINGRGALGFVVDKGERYAAAFGYGYMKGKLHEKFMWKGMGLDLVTGVALVASSVVANVASGGRSHLAAHLERVGDAGVSSYLNSIGASMGAQSAGRSVMVLDSGKTPGKTAIKGHSIVGEIPPAMGGAYLTADELNHFSARR